MVEMLALRMWMRRYPPLDTNRAMLYCIPGHSPPSDPLYDMNGDGRVTSLDALMILQMAVGDLIL
ncbi:MAG: hypothetical protein GIS02_04320 [Methanosarcinales archaeon]|uniref:Dockerin domain-containing protein n=1 Tax=Candidatus Ethanoperedens thermophilum TaxID=2766897 RepID=A0A848DA66_9EURY|nr:hypothetical protein [Candidatus Ethanoperedens thermophilum]